MKMKPFLFLLPTLMFCMTALAETTYQPFVLASVSDATLAKQTEITTDQLIDAGFTIAGMYSPIDNANVIVVTNPDLLKIASLSDRGGYGAGERISITERDGKTEVAFVNPLYIQFAYRMDNDLQGLHDQLSSTLGNIEAFGAEKAMTAKKLGKYHYMMGMPYFDKPWKLGSFESHEAAVAAVEEGLAKQGDALSQVYRIDIPGKDQTVFGVGMKDTGASKDETEIDSAHQLAIVDFEGNSKVAYFPYEVLVDGKNVEALHMRFRMAVHFPDLSMTGKHGFTKLISAPGATKKAFEAILETE